MSFTVVNRKTGEFAHLERDYVRTVRIKQHEAQNQRRPIVLMNVCIGIEIHEVEFTLADRGEFLYPVLLGLSALEDIAVVDPSLTFTAKPRCNVAERADD